MANKCKNRFKNVEQEKEKARTKRKMLLIIIPLVIVILTTIVGYASTKEVIIKHERLDTGVCGIYLGRW